MHEFFEDLGEVLKFIFNALVNSADFWDWSPSSNRSNYPDPVRKTEKRPVTRKEETSPDPIEKLKKVQ